VKLKLNRGPFKYGKLLHHLWQENRMTLNTDPRTSKLRSEETGEEELSQDVTK